MWVLKVILFVLPAIAYCSIRIRITPGETEAETTVDFSGSDTEIISDKEQKTFKLDESSLNKAVKAWLGNTCTDIYVKPPTKFGDVYEKYGWEPVKRTLRPVGHKIIGITPKPDAIVTAEYESTKSSIPVQYSTTIQMSAEQEVSHGWTTSGELNIGREITYSVNVGAATVGGTTSLSYTSGWGQEKSESKTLTIGTVSTIQVVVPPGQKAMASLTAASASLEVEIYYEASLNYGDVFCNYENKYEGVHFYGHPLSILQDYGNLPKKVNSTERLTVGFYSQAKLKVVD